MIRETLQSFCRFYKGEMKCPFKEADKQMFWLSEKWWVEQTELANEAGDKRISPLIDEYMNAGLSQFEKYDSVPITLKAVLFNRYCKYMERIDIEGFKHIYLVKYMERGGG
jgi:hypothetical protein